MKKYILILIVSVVWSLPVSAQSSHNEANTEEIIESDLNTEEVNSIQEPGMNPMGIISSIMNEQSPVLPDPSNTPGDPGNPDAPIDAHIWFLLILVAAFGAYQYKKQSTKTA
jgi:hypothetical protein